ncbi:MAG: group II intron reverse transcriptase/maturase, partial [Planctomycetes bacterium]|nr:group II intron reverse transcriptase/maturase [Planctomycetota bacterium]
DSAESEVWSLRTLSVAFAKVADSAESASNRRAAGSDLQTIAMFEKQVEANLQRLHDELRSGMYRPRPVRRVWIPKPGTHEKRPLGIPTVRDRVVQTALRMVIEPIFERDFAASSYGFRPGRGCKDALRRVDALLRAGYTHVVDVDLKSYFDTIPHAKLGLRLRSKLADGRVLELVEAYLTQRVMDGLETWTPVQGSPQGATLSPLLSNIYLDPLDHQMAERGFEMIRYADDMVVLCRSESEAREALDLVQAWTAEADLTLHPIKTRIVNANRSGFEFLGYRFERGSRWPRNKSRQRLQEAIRSKTRRTNGHSLTKIIADVNRTTRGWFEYFKHSHRWTFTRLDAWIRMRTLLSPRLRSILRKRHGRRGRGRGADHHRWPNAYFTTRGLFLMATTHAAVCQSARR